MRQMLEKLSGPQRNPPNKHSSGVVGPFKTTVRASHPVTRGRKKLAVSGIPVVVNDLGIEV